MTVSRILNGKELSIKDYEMAKGIRDKYGFKKQAVPPDTVPVPQNKDSDSFKGQDVVRDSLLPKTRKRTLKIK